LNIILQSSSAQDDICVGSLVLTDCPCFICGKVVSILGLICKSETVFGIQFLNDNRKVVELFYSAIIASQKSTESMITHLPNSTSSDIPLD
jgi:hypothetical protein